MSHHKFAWVDCPECKEASQAMHYMQSGLELKEQRDALYEAAKALIDGGTEFTNGDFDELRASIKLAENGEKME